MVILYRETEQKCLFMLSLDRVSILTEFYGLELVFYVMFGLAFFGLKISMKIGRELGPVTEKIMYVFC